MENNDPKITPPAGNPNDGNNGGSKGENLIPQEKLNDIISARLKEEREKNAKETAAAIEKARQEAKEEAERQAKLTAEEREKEEKARSDAEFKAREQSVALREMTLEAKVMLQEKNIPIDLVDLVVNIDKEKTKANVDLLATAYNKAVEKGVADKLAGSPPKDPAKNNEPSNKNVSSAF